MTVLVASAQSPPLRVSDCLPEEPLPAAPATTQHTQTAADFEVVPALLAWCVPCLAFDLGATRPSPVRDGRRDLELPSRGNCDARLRLAGASGQPAARRLGPPLTALLPRIAQETVGLVGMDATAVKPLWCDATGSKLGLRLR